MADDRVEGARQYGAQPSLDPKTDPDSKEFVNPFTSSNAALGLPEAGPSNRPTNWTEDDEKAAREKAQKSAAKVDKDYHG